MNMKEINNLIIPDDTYADICVIFDMMPESLLEKINKKFIEFVKKKAIETKGISDINPYIPIREQKLSKETETFLSLIYSSYFKDNEEIDKDTNEKINNITNDNKEIINNNKLIDVKRTSIIEIILNFLRRILWKRR